MQLRSAPTGGGVPGWLELSMLLTYLTITYFSGPHYTLRNHLSTCIANGEKPIPSLPGLGWEWLGVLLKDDRMHDFS